MSFCISEIAEVQLYWNQTELSSITGGLLFSFHKVKTHLSSSDRRKENLTSCCHGFHSDIVMIIRRIHTFVKNFSWADLWRGFLLSRVLLELLLCCIHQSMQFTVSRVFAAL